MRPLRMFRTLRRRLVERGRPIIYVYHRVADVRCDPWRLAVPPEQFARQIEALVQERRVVPLRWLASKLAEGRVPRDMAVVTFDDGYADVLANGRAVLERHTCPATVFLTTGAIGSPDGFWWDELSRLVLESPALPAELEIELHGRMERWQLDEPVANGGPEYAGKPAGTSRSELHLALWRLLRRLDAASRGDVLDVLHCWAGIARQSPSASRALDADEVRRLADPGFVDIGAHSVTHPSMPLLDRFERRSELEGSRRTCEELTGSEVDAFAYPFGDLDDASVADVRAAGFTTACSTEGRAVSRRSDPLRLPRMMPTCGR